MCTAHSLLSVLSSPPCSSLRAWRLSFSFLSLPLFFLSPLSLLLFGSSETRARMLLDTTVNEDGAIFCSHCEMWLNGPTQWEDHKIGTKHKKCVRRKGTRLGWVRKGSGMEGARHTSPAADFAARDDSFLLLAMMVVPTSPVEALCLPWADSAPLERCCSIQGDAALPERWCYSEPVCTCTLRLFGVLVLHLAFFCSLSLLLPFSALALVALFPLLFPLVFCASAACLRPLLLLRAFAFFVCLVVVCVLLCSFLCGRSGSILSGLVPSPRPFLAPPSNPAMAVRKARRYRCQCCYSHRPSSWLRCRLCGRWVGKGCHPECCWVTCTRTCRACLMLLFSRPLPQDVSLIVLGFLD